ncbi:DinB family protein [Brevibacillus brevis]|uniref:DinB family protein n=1 Tax=Brevibacillus brevis TaxID=1393 RepID=A0ABY9T5M0_BREBE|nr:DinB family protein [Brevibacillus brevis]WNC15198.1 DinB family protein [Brevibacillus brevis]
MDWMIWYAGFAEVAEKFKDFFSQIDLDGSSSYSHPVMGTLVAPYSTIIQHVVNHGTYHRGNISAMLGHAGASHDYIFYLFEKKDER